MTKKLTCNERTNWCIKKEKWKMKCRIYFFLWEVENTRKRYYLLAIWVWKELWQSCPLDQCDVVHTGVGCSIEWFAICGQENILALIYPFQLSPTKLGLGRSLQTPKLMTSSAETALSSEESQKRVQMGHKHLLPIWRLCLPSVRFRNF